MHAALQFGSFAKEMSIL